MPKISPATTVQHFRKKLNGSPCSKRKHKGRHGRLVSLPAAPPHGRICLFASAISIVNICLTVRAQHPGGKGKRRKYRIEGGGRQVPEGRLSRGSRERKRSCPSDRAPGRWLPAALHGAAGEPPQGGPFLSWLCVFLPSLSPVSPAPTGWHLPSVQPATSAPALDPASGSSPLPRAHVSSPSASTSTQRRKLNSNDDSRRLAPKARYPRWPRCPRETPSAGRKGFRQPSQGSAGQSASPGTPGTSGTETAAQEIDA